MTNRERKTAELACDKIAISTRLLISAAIHCHDVGSGLEALDRRKAAEQDLKHDLMALLILVGLID